MGITVIILMVVVGVLLLLLRSVALPQAALSTFELARRVAEDDPSIKHEHKRQEALPLLESALDGVVAILTALFIALAMAAWQWGGVVIAIAVLVLLNPLSRVAIIRKVGSAVYMKQEKRIQKLVLHKHVRPVLHFLRGQTEVVSERMLGSYEELVYLIEQSDVVSKGEQQLLFRALDFPHQIVHEVFTSHKKVTTVDEKEVLGPKLLDELHQSGQSFFPVVDGSFEKVVGILPAQDILNTQRQGKLTAKKAMDELVVYIPEGDSLESALRTLLHERQYYGIVVNKSEENIGVITIDDIIAALLGPAS